MSIEEEHSSSIGSGGFVICELEELKSTTHSITVGELKKVGSEHVVNEIRNYYNSYSDINGRPPSKIDFNNFLDNLL